MKIQRDEILQIKKTLRDVAYLLPDKAREVILEENEGKRLFDVGQIIKRAKENSRILDLGGGFGVNLLVLSRLQHDYKLFLIDRFEEYTKNSKMGDVEIALYLLNKAKINVVKQDFVQNPTLPYESNFFDIVTCFGVIEHFPCNPIEQLKELYRVLKSGGHLLIAVPNAIALTRRQALLLGKVPYIPFELWCQDKYYSHYREYSPKELYRLLEMTGFVEIHIELRSQTVASIANVRRAYQNNFFRTILPQIVLRTNSLIEKLVPGFRESIYCFARCANK